VAVIVSATALVVSIAAAVDAASGVFPEPSIVLAASALSNVSIC
jgi:hypothetical protein